LAIVILLLLAACGSGAGPSAPPPGERIACAIGEGAAFVPGCTAERQGDALVLHHPDGGFRRLTIVTDGRGVITADGAEPARVTVAGDGIEVAVGPDRYRLPARIAGR
jgi:hypothetical protein